MEQELEQLKTEVQELTDKLDGLVTAFSGIDPSNLLNPNLDTSSKRTIVQTLERTWDITAETVGAGFTIDPKTRTHELTGTASRTSDTTTAIKDGAYKGQLLILIGTDDTNTIIIKTAANTHLTGDITLGEDDTLSLIWNGTSWLELATSNN